MTSSRAPGGREVSRPTALWLAVVVFTGIMLGTTLPTPLYVLYQKEWHFSDALITVIFAVYAIGVLVALLFAGRSSDTAGRRPVLLVALACASASTVVFIVASDTALLFVGRVLSGFSAGLVTGTATAWIADLAGPTRLRRGSMAATAANVGGLSLGPLVAGLFAQYLPRPTVLVFDVYLALLVVLAVFVVINPETVAVSGPIALRRPLLGVPREVRGRFTSAALAAFTAFTVMGLFTALAPSFLKVDLHETNHAVEGAVVFLLFGTAAVTQLVAPALSRSTTALGGTACMLATLGLITAGISDHALTAFVCGAAIGGIATGLMFSWSLTAANDLAPGERRAQVISAYFVVAYVGLAIPVIGVGIATQQLGDFRATLGAAIVLSVLAGVSVLGRGRGRAVTSGP